jgi:exosortase D (VPLPA-CTERM-specific)
MTPDTRRTHPTWSFGPTVAGLAMVALALLVLSTLDGWQKMIHVWDIKEAYSYGYMIPPIVAFLLWQRKDVLERIEFRGSWSGLLVMALGVALVVFGKLTTITTLIHYGFVIAVMGMALALMGMAAFRVVFVPLSLLLFMVPLPSFLYNNLSTKLQLLSTGLGVAVTRLFGISVYVEGNVIDLGSYQLQVVEACSGLNYLFPLMTLAFIMAYFYKTALWKRAIVFLSSIPITVLMNSFRIGVIGVLVEYWGTEQAEGFLHFFEGWVIFMACLAILLLEIRLLAKLTNDRRPWAEVFGIEFPAATPKDVPRQPRRLTAPFIAAAALALSSALAAAALKDRNEIIPARKAFAEFPLSVGDWSGQSSRIEAIYLDELKLDDYVLVDFKQPAQSAPVNFYSAYYATQRADQSAHSPRSCLPGGGWLLKGFGQRTLDGVNGPNGALRVNRSVIQKGEDRQLAYYWFQQRGRDITNEYAVKWYLFVDSLKRRRTDGAMIRLITPLAPTEDIAAGDARLTSFARTVVPLLPDYIPN